jgi:hypothetical protein
MGLFTRRRPAAAGSDYDGPPPAALRGRAGELADAGAVPWEVLWEAMKVVPPSPGAGSLTHELGLDWGEQQRHGWAGVDHMRGDRYHGARHGRQVEVRVQAATRGARATPIQATWVRAATAPFMVTADDGAFAISADGYGDGDASGGAATDFIMSLQPSPAWDHLVVRGGADGIAAQRRTTMHGQNVGWLYDLWLAERLLDVLDATALAPLADVGGRALPYGLG